MPATPINATILYIMHGGNKISNQLNAELKVSMSMRESLTKDNDGYKAKFPGPRDWEMTCEAEVAYDSDYGFVDLFEAFEEGEPVEVIFTTTITGSARYKGDAIITELSKSAGVEDNARINVTLMGSGGVSTEAVPAPPEPDND
jgi:predicted secreted protein